MANNLALFVTHHVFLTDDEIRDVISGVKLIRCGSCVPVWVNASTGNTTEPAKEIFCAYELSLSDGGPGFIEPNDKGYHVKVPKASQWRPPKKIDFESLASLSAEERALFLKSRDNWWFNNPKPMDVEELAKGYVRFDLKQTELKIGRRKYSSHHVVEISSMRRLEDSLTV